jgi:hypothetical protein
LIKDFCELDPVVLGLPLFAAEVLDHADVSKVVRHRRLNFDEEVRCVGEVEKVEAHVTTNRLEYFKVAMMYDEHRQGLKRNFFSTHIVLQLNNMGKNALFSKVGGGPLTSSKP